MKITAIAPNNNYNKTVFKGESRTYYKQRCSSYTTEERFYLPDRLITLHQPDSNAREVTAYIASPFEIVSEDNLNKNNFLQRNDLFLSQIKKDYRNGYFSFAENAREEIKFLTGLRDDLKTRYERNKELISRYNDRNGTEIFSASILPTANRVPRIFTIIAPWRFRFITRILLPQVRPSA